MDDELFKQKLSEVAQWRMPSTVTGTKSGEAKRPRKRGRPSAEDLYQEEHEQVFLEMFNGINPTFPLQLVKVKCQSTICEDCGKLCENGINKEKKQYESNKIKHWRERCVTCGFCQNPYTGAFDLPSAKASMVWNSYLRETKGAYVSKGNLAKQAKNSQETITIHREISSDK